MKSFFAFCIFLALFSVSIASAQKKPQTDDIQKFEELGGKVLYLGRVHDLDQWGFVSRDGEMKFILYETPAGALIKGKVFNPDGTPLGAKQKAEIFFDAVRAAHSVTIGNPKTPAVYVFVVLGDADTLKLWNLVKGDVEAAKFHLRVLPVGRDKENQKRGSALLASATPRERWDEEMSGNPKIAAEPSEESLDKLLQNTALSRKWEIPAFPFTVYRKLTDGKMMTFAGVPTVYVLPDEFE